MRKRAAFNLGWNARMDPHERCDVGGLAGITSGLLAQRERMVFDWSSSRETAIAFVLAGGYTGRALSAGRLVDLHRLTIGASCAEPCL